MNIFKKHLDSRKKMNKTVTEIIEEVNLTHLGEIRTYLKNDKKITISRTTDGYYFYKSFDKDGEDRI